MKAYILSFKSYNYGDPPKMTRVYLEKDFDQAQKDLEAIKSGLTNDEVFLDEIELYRSEDDK